MNRGRLPCVTGHLCPTYLLSPIFFAKFFPLDSTFKYIEIINDESNYVKSHDLNSSQWFLETIEKFRKSFNN